MTAPTPEIPRSLTRTQAVLVRAGIVGTGLLLFVISWTEHLCH